MEETVKRRGRKKVLSNEEASQEPQEEPIKKKRGRKKKWETTPFKNNYSTDGNERVTFKEANKVDPEKYNTNALNFGNLCIEVHDKETDQDITLDNYFVNKKDPECEIELSSDEEDTCNTKKDPLKNLRHYTNNRDATNIKLNPTEIRCFNCHHTFSNTPFFLPYDYSNVLDRYKLFGNFCSPNCVKAYSINSKTFHNKTHIIGQFYRKLFGPQFRITPAPSILNIDSYGGKMSIEEFRKSLYTNSRYTINNINCKVQYIT